MGGDLREALGEEGEVVRSSSSKGLVLMIDVFYGKLGG
jgi:hypothetical protein